MSDLINEFEQTQSSNKSAILSILKSMDSRNLATNADLGQVKITVAQLADDVQRSDQSHRIDELTRVYKELQQEMAQLKASADSVPKELIQKEFIHGSLERKAAIDF